jgi:CII-binding regulator of phage lambda lysogenization HflD
MTRLDPSTEKSRQTPYRRLYTHIYKLRDELARQDSCITYLLNEIRALQKRAEQLEKRNENLVASALRVAFDTAQEVRGVGQRGDLQLSEAGDPPVGHPAPVDGR